MPELKQLEETVRAAADLNDVSSVGASADAGSALDNAKMGEDGYLLDDELYNSLKSYMSVQIETPKDKLKVRGNGGLALRTRARSERRTPF